MKFGELDFLQKPFSSDAIIARVLAVVKVGREARGGEIDGLANFLGRHLLTCREREVLSQAKGASNKEAGRRLGIGPRTVEVHRARIMECRRSDADRVVRGECAAADVRVLSDRYSAAASDFVRNGRSRRSHT